MTTDIPRRSQVGDMAWQRHGACLDGTLPWTAEPVDTTPRQRQSMRALCRGCRVLSDCDGFAEREEVTAAFWAGTHRGPDVDRLRGSGWAAQTLPGLGGLSGAA